MSATCLCMIWLQHLCKYCKTDLDHRGGVVEDLGEVKLWNCSGQQVDARRRRLTVLPCSSAQEVVCTPLGFFCLFLPTQMISLNAFFTQICIDLVFIEWCLVLAIKLSWFSLLRKKKKKKVLLGQQTQSLLLCFFLLHSVFCFFLKLFNGGGWICDLHHSNRIEILTHAAN